MQCERIPAEKSLEVVPRHTHQLRGFGSSCRRRTRRFVQKRHLTEAVPFAADRELLFGPIRARLRNLDRAPKDGAEGVARLTLLEECLAGFNRPTTNDGRNRVQVIVRESLEEIDLLEQGDDFLSGPFLRALRHGSSPRGLLEGCCDTYPALERRFPWLLDYLVLLDLDPLWARLAPLLTPVHWLIAVVAGPPAAILDWLVVRFGAVSGLFSSAVWSVLSALPMPGLAQDLLWVRPVEPFRPIEHDAQAVVKRQYKTVRWWSYIAAFTIHACVFIF